MGEAEIPEARGWSVVGTKMPLQANRILRQG
jgi:hypothetical protein